MFKSERELLNYLNKLIDYRLDSETTNYLIGLKKLIIKQKQEIRYLRNLNFKYSNQLDQHIMVKDRAIEFVERYLRVNLEAFDTKSLLEKILKILNRDVI